MQQALPDELQLVGQHAALEPLDVRHIPALQMAASDGQLWNLHFTSVPNHAGCSDYVSLAMSNRGKGQQLPFAVRRLSVGGAVWLVVCVRAM